MSFNNLSKVFVYENELGERITLTYENGYLINKPTGIDTLSVSLGEAKGIDQIGSSVQSRNINSRPIVVSGRLCNIAQAEHKEQLLIVVRPDLKGRLYADDFYLDVYPTATPTIGAAPQFANFQFSLLAPYPYWQHAETKEASLLVMEKKFKFPWNISRQYRYGEKVRETFVELTNGGQVEVPYTVAFEATDSVSNPRIIQVSNNAYLKLNKALVASERVVVEISHDRVSAVSSVDGECNGAIDLGSTFFRLKVGGNTIKPDADSGADNLNVSISFRAEKAGVYA